MTGTMLPPPIRRWECPNCDATDATRDVKPHTRFHRCAGLAGLTTPMVPAGTRAKVERVERGDWVGAEQVPTDADGRPVMAVVTTRDDGQDCTVYAATATARQE